MHGVRPLSKYRGGSHQYADDQPRCKICADPIGEAADLVASDVWPGGGPTGRMLATTASSHAPPQALNCLNRPRRPGSSSLSARIGFRDLDVFQPHQVRKRRAIWARFAGMKAAGRPTPEAQGPRLADLARENSLAGNLTEARGARARARRLLRLCSKALMGPL